MIYRWLTKIAPILALSVAGCADSAIDPIQPHPGAGSGSDAPTNPLPILMTCKMQPHVSGSSFDAAELVCTYQPPAGVPLQAQIALTAASKSEPSINTAVVFDDSKVGAATSVLQVTAAQLPLELEADIFLSSSQIRGLDVSSIAQHLEFTAEDTSAGIVHTVGLPFGIWKVTVALDVDFTSGLLDPYTLDLGESMPASPVTVRAFLLGGTPGTTQTAYFAVGPDTVALTGKTDVDPVFSFSLTGGGDYVVDATGLHAGTATQPDAGPTTACGSDRQPQCYDQNGFPSCNNGFSFSPTDNLCHTCGGDGQPQCYDQSGFPYCNPGLSNGADGMCHAQ